MENTMEGCMKVIEEKRVGECLAAESKIIIPIIKVFIAFCGKETLNGGYFSIAPYAIIVVDSKGESLFSLSGEDIKMNDVIKEVPDLMEKIREVKAVLVL